MNRDWRNIARVLGFCTLLVVALDVESYAYDYSERMAGEAVLPLAYPDRPFVLRFSRDDLLEQPVWSTRLDAIIIPKSSPACVRVGAEALRQSVLALELGQPGIVEIDADTDKLELTTAGGDVVLMGTMSGSRLVASLAQKHGLAVDDTTMNGDGYIIKPITESGRRLILVTASSERGAMYGAYELEERTTKRGIPLLDDTFVPRVRYRSWALHTFVDEPYSLIGRMRLNVSMSFDDYWPGTIFYPDFPELGGEQKREYILSQQARLHEKFANAKKYGALTAMVINPLGFLSCASRNNDEEYRQALSKAHPGILATPGGLRCNLCPSNEATRKFAVAGIKEFVETYPELDMIILQFSDMGGELNCACDKCKNYPMVDRIVDYAQLAMDTARAVKPEIRFMMREHALPGMISMQQPEYRTDPTVGFREITHRLGKDMEAIIMRLTTPPGGDFQNWFSPDSTMLGQQVPLYFLFHYYEAGGPGVVAPLSPVESHLSWALPLYLEKLRTFVQPGQGLIGCTSPVAGMEVAYWHPDLDAHKYIRNWCRAKYGDDAGNYMHQALEGTDKITSAFFLQPSCSESYDMYRWGPYGKPWAVDMAPFAQIGLTGPVDGIASGGFMMAHAPQPEDLQKATPAQVGKWLERFEVREAIAIAERAEAMTAKALKAQPDEPELQYLARVAKATNQLAHLFREYHLALVQANAARNATEGDGNREKLIEQSRSHLKCAIGYSAEYGRIYLVIINNLGSRYTSQHLLHPEVDGGEKLQFHRLWWDLSRTYLPTILCQVREAAYLQDKEFGGQEALAYFDEQMGLNAPA